MTADERCAVAALRCFTIPTGLSSPYAAYKRRTKTAAERVTLANMDELLKQSHLAKFGNLDQLDKQFWSMYAEISREIVAASVLI